MKKQVILSLSPFGHDTAAALMINGEVVAACEQERYTRDKHSRLFPIDAVKDCLSIAGISINDVDMIAVTWLPKLQIREFYLRYALTNDKRLSFLMNDLPTIQNLFDIKNIISKKLNYNGRIECLNHHLCHLASTYYSSGFDDTLVVSYDGFGEIDTMAIGIGVNGKISVKENGNKYPHSLGLLYAAVTHYLGWKYCYDEGVVMGLASFGDPNAIIPGKDKSYLQVFEKTLEIKDDFIFELNLPDYMNFFDARDVWIGNKFIEYFGPKRNKNNEITPHHMNIAAGLQRRIEDVVIFQLKAAKKKYRKNKLCISGGVGLNCTMNGKISSLKIFDEIFVVPPSGDEGTTIGACYMGHKLLGHEISTKKRHDFYLGSRFDNKEILDTILDYNLNYYKSDNIYKDTAERLASGKIVAWFQGGAEFGPRALGNRSILTKPYPAEMKDYLNKRVKFREPFRPYAPAVLKEYANDYFNIEQESPHMLIAVQAKDSKKEKIAATVHFDGSSRVQTVGKENNLHFWKLLNAFYDKTKIPVILNTSFNVKGQPIVNKPKEAIETFLNTNIDSLVIGDIIIDKRNNGT
jgi:carbamoyltransferase